jgi:DNA primase
MTTTAIDLDEELLNRCLVLTVDENREQTKKIHALQREKRTLAGLTKKHTKTAILTTHQHAQRLLKPLAIVNPYADRLTFLDDRTRTRRDHEKYLTLIDTIALLHQYQREIKTTLIDDKPVQYTEVTIADIEAANAIAHEVLGRSLDELPPQTRRLLSLTVDYVKALMIEQQCQRADARFTRKQLRAVTGWGDTQLKVHLARLVELEYVQVHREGRGKINDTRQGQFNYELQFDGDASMAVYLSGLIDVSELKASVKSGYDANRSGQDENWSGSGRVEVGVQSAGGQGVKTSALPSGMRVTSELTIKALETTLPHADEIDPVIPYPQAILKAQASASALPSLAASEAF